MVVFHRFLYIYQRISLLTVWVQPLNSPIIGDLLISLQRNAAFGIPTSIDFRHALRRAPVRNRQVGVYHLVICYIANSLPWKITISKNGKPSISIRAIYTMAMLNNQRVIRLNVGFMFEISIFRCFTIYLYLLWKITMFQFGKSTNYSWQFSILLDLW